ncbi:tyrosine-type recombinase/integrase [Leeuwenhoekiella parthenopeia]|uniref:Site-specific integrase n=1 Tax=Leeuwenhoekiella parthenopeia TaxID=2890320 RepID=A0ABS8GVS0_9FLAO|nr:phage integrase SAM-like domain-containing protein [Leeuwenhoekiella parthenopeia]MCC4214095.1 site-specific integrase [Leeuwenhoekiella parthenopeia]
MAKLTYKLRPATGKNTSIQLVFNYGTGKRFRYSTGLKVSDSKNWDETKMRIRKVTSELNRQDINNKLDEVQAKINKEYSNLRTNLGQVINNDKLKVICDEVLFPERLVNDEVEKLELLPFFHCFLNNYKTNPLPTSGKPLGSGTIRTYKNTLTKLEKFSSEQYKITFDKITLDFYDDFVNWLYENNYSTNYVGTIIKILKTVMSAAFERDLHNNLDYSKRYFSKPTEQVNNIYLTTEELKRIYNYDLSQEPTHIHENGLKMTSKLLTRARDLFLIGANTGLRVSDFNRLTAKNIVTRNENQYIEVVTKKNNKAITIPINWMVSDILKRNEGKPPKRMPDQHINYCIKKVAELAEINESVSKEITKGGKKVIKTHKKFQLVANHTARRSFCTNAYLSGMHTIDIMAISGHSSEKVFYNYIKVSHFERAEKLGKHKFFSNTNLRVVND